MSAQDLIPLDRRTKDEQKEIAKKGGVKSGETRRRKSALKQIAKQFLDSNTDREDLRDLLIAKGFDEEQTNAAALILQIANEAFSGNIRAAELLIRLSGEDPDQKRKDAELKIKREELKVKQALIRQQTIKLKNDNFGNDDLDWLIRYSPDNTTNEVWLQIAAVEIEEFVQNGGNIEDVTEKWQTWINEYATRKYAEQLIQMKKKMLKEEL